MEIVYGLLDICGTSLTPTFDAKVNLTTTLLAGTEVVELKVVLAW
jgi:hypothetical protein